MDQILQNVLIYANKSKKNARQIVSFIRRTLKIQKKIIQVKENGVSKDFVVRREGVGPINTGKYGKFLMFVFNIDDLWGKYYAIVKVESTDEHDMPILKNNRSLFIRIDSGCETGQRFHDITCECKEQLEKAMEMIQQEGEGMIICIPNQDGRGKGLPWKLATLELQEKLGLDTVQAAEILTKIESEMSSDSNETIINIDTRSYTGIISILKYFGIDSTTRIKLATNNPEKLKIFNDNGYIIESIPVIIKPTKKTKKHLLAKQNQLGHILFL